MSAYLNRLPISPLIFWDAAPLWHSAAGLRREGEIVKTGGMGEEVHDEEIILPFAGKFGNHFTTGSTRDSRRSSASFRMAGVVAITLVSEAMSKIVSMAIGRASGSVEALP